MEDKKLTLVGHLDELRARVFKSLVAVIAGATCVYIFVEKIFDSLIKPVGQLVFIAPQEAFIARVKIAFLGGIFLALPVIIYQTWRFIQDGLQPNEKRYAALFGPVSLLFFIIGSSFGYYIIVPIGVKFLLGFATESIVPMISVSKYISFVGLLTLVFGVVFELPLASLFLTKIGVVTPRFLSQKRRHAIVIIFIAAAIFTPPDVVTQCLLAIPLVVLYEIGLLFSRAVYKDPYANPATNSK
ncbi:MAG: twin-arginine translocase subunit TatC [Candidatus Omnitrophota bacterium]